MKTARIEKSALRGRKIAATIELNEVFTSWSGGLGHAVGGYDADGRHWRINLDDATVAELAARHARHVKFATEK